MKKITKKNLIATTLDIIDFIDEQNCWYDVNIYVAGKQFKSNIFGNAFGFVEKTTSNGTIYYEKDDVDVEEKLEYCNKDTISMTFEGPLHDLINYEDYDFVAKMNTRFLDEYGLHFERGYSWSMAAYK